MTNLSDIFISGTSGSSGSSGTSGSGTSGTSGVSGTSGSSGSSGTSGGTSGSSGTSGASSGTSGTSGVTLGGNLTQDLNANGYAIYARDHEASGTSGEAINMIYGTSATPPMDATNYSIGTIYVEYVP